MDNMQQQNKDHSKRALLSLLLLVTSCAFLAPGCGCDAGKLHVVWKVSGIAPSSLEEADNVLIVYDFDGGTLSAFELSNGRRIWSSAYSLGYDVSTKHLFRIDDNRLFVPLGVEVDPENRCLIAELDPRTGRQLREYEFWTHYPVNEFSRNAGWLSDFDVCDTSLVAVTDDGLFKAVDRLSGNTMWEQTLSPGAKEIETEDDLIFVVGETVAAFRLSSGEEVWERSIMTDCYSCVSKNLLFVSESNPKGLCETLHALDTKTGNDVWTCTNEAFMGITTRAYDGRLLACDYLGPLVCVDITTGRMLWSFKTRGTHGDSDYPVGLPVVVDGVVYYTALDGHFYALDLDTGKPIDRYNIHYGCAPTTDGQYVYVGGGLGHNYKSKNGQYVYVGGGPHYLYKFKKIQKSQ